MLYTQEFYTVRTSLSGNDQHQLVWVRLHTLDNDPHRFWRTFTGALRAWDLPYAQKEQQAGFPKTEAALLRFQQALQKETSSHPLVIIINRLHLIHNEQIERFLDVLVRVQAPGLLVQLMSSPTSEQEIAAELQTHKFQYFTAEDEHAYYTENGISLNDVQFRQVRGFTDGWSPAVIILAADHLGPENIDAVFVDFDAYISHWVNERYREGFNEAEGRLFTLMTLLDEYPPELLYRLSGWSGEATMNLLETSPFLRLNAKTDRFYLCGHLYRHLIRSQYLLEKKEIHQFLVKAGDWYRDKGHKADAIACYRKVDANQKILQVLQQWIFPPSWETAACYIETIGALPASFRSKHPILEVLLAHSLGAQYRYTEVEALMEGFCLQHDHGDDTAEEMRPLLGEAYIMWATCASVREDYEHLLGRYRRAAELLPGGSSMMCNKVSVRADMPVLKLNGGGLEGLRKNIEFAKELEPYLIHAMSGGDAGVAALYEAEVNFYTRCFGEVEDPAYSAVYTAMEWNQYDVACSAYLLLMRYYLAKGSADKLMTALKRLRETARKQRYQGFFTMPDIAEAWLALKLGKHSEVPGWFLDDQKVEKLLNPWNIGRNLLVRCGWLLENQHYEAVISYVDRCADLMKKRGETLLALQLMMMKAIACNRTGAEEDAVTIFAEIYREVSGCNLIMLVVEYGGFVPPLVSLYRKQGDGSIPEEWLAIVEKKAKTYQSCVYKVRTGLESKQPGKDSPLDSLTPLERKTLLLLSNGMTVPEISQAQNRTVWAVRSTLKGIYSKIGAANKTEATKIATRYNIEQYVDA